MIAHWPRRRPGLVFVALALILLGSLFPRGYMPVSDGGRITVTLCSAYGAQHSVTIDVGGKRSSPQHTGSSNCWGVFTGLGLVATAAPLPSPSIDWPAAPRPLPRVSVARVFHFDPNAPPQAPPSSAS